MRRTPMNDSEEGLTFALAGNANVGKSVIFNQLTGLSQIIGNWPGKTVERAMGTLFFEGRRITVVDLPGIYSLSTYSEEEIVSRQFIAEEKPDAVIDVVDATVLERNLFFTLQLMELEAPLVIALNMFDVAQKRGIKIDVDALSKALGVPIVPTVATKRVGLTDLLRKAVMIATSKPRRKPKQLKYGTEVESRIQRLSSLIREKALPLPYPPRWIAIKLLEEDEEVTRAVEDQEIHSLASKLRDEIETIHGEPAATVISSERYTLASRIASSCQTFLHHGALPLSTALDQATTHRFWGYLIMLAVTLGLFFSIFSFGNWLSSVFEAGFDLLRPTLGDLLGAGPLARILSEGVLEGVFAGITIAIPYILPFYFALSILEDSGYLARIAFLMDSAMHKIGLHGKAFIPMLLGFGCNVPAVLGCRIMETRRERLIAAFVATLVPCSARTIVILALVGRYLGAGYALSLYVIDLAIIFILGRFAYKALPGTPVGLIMEMPPYRKPSVSITSKQTWFRLSGFVKMAFPLIIVAGAVIKAMEVYGLLDVVSSLISPVTVGLLGLPSITGVLLIVGILRKELTLLMLASLLGTSQFNAVLTPIQMYVFSFVVMLYIPCIATIAVLVQELGWKDATYITIFEISFAILTGGLVYRILPLLGW